MDFSLDSAYFSNVAKFVNIDKDSLKDPKTIIINGIYKIEMPELLAVTVSTKFANMLKTKRTTNSLTINIKDTGNIKETLDKIKRAIVSQENVTVTDDDIPVFTSFGLEIGNDDFLRPSIEQIRRLNKPLNESSVIDLIPTKIALNIDDISREIIFVAENFTAMENNENFIQYSSNIRNIDTIEHIISDKRIKLELEDTLVNFIMKVIIRSNYNTKLLRLFNFVFLEYCSVEKCKELLHFYGDLIKCEDMRHIFSCLGRRVLQLIDILPLRVRHNDIGVEFSSRAGKYKGIINYLTDKHKGNIYKKNIIDIKASSTYDNNGTYGKYEHLVQEYGDWGTSKLEEDTWLMFDFLQSKVAIDGYTMRSNSSSWAARNRSWILEGSNDKKSWTLIDQQKDQECLNGAHRDNTFYCPLSDYYRYLRLKRVGKSWNGFNYLSLSRIEFFGRFLELQQKE